MDLNFSSDLILNKFYITNTSLLSIYPEKGQRIRLDKLKVICDFDVFTAEREKDGNLNFMINFNVTCNEEEKPGYFFDIGAAGEFTLKNTDNIEEKTVQQYILYTSLPMIINSTRVYIQQITAMHSFGTYLLPVLDLGKLIEKKSLEEETPEE